MVSSNHYFLPSWPPNDGDHNHAITISATILLPDKFYSQSLEREVPDSETGLLPSQKRAGPAILAGLSEGVKRGQEGGGPPVKFDIVIRDTHCDITYGPKVKLV